MLLLSIINFISCTFMALVSAAAAGIPQFEPPQMVAYCRQHEELPPKVLSTQLCKLFFANLSLKGPNEEKTKAILDYLRVCRPSINSLEHVTALNDFIITRDRRIAKEINTIKEAVLQANRLLDLLPIEDRVSLKSTAVGYMQSTASPELNEEAISILRALPEEERARILPYVGLLTGETIREDNSILKIMVRFPFVKRKKCLELVIKYKDQLPNHLKVVCLALAKYYSPDKMEKIILFIETKITTFQPNDKQVDLFFALATLEPHEYEAGAEILANLLGIKREQCVDGFEVVEEPDPALNRLFGLKVLQYCDDAMLEPDMDIDEKDQKSSFPEPISDPEDKYKHLHRALESIDAADRLAVLALVTQFVPQASKKLSIEYQYSRLLLAIALLPKDGRSSKALYCLCHFFDLQIDTLEDTKKFLVKLSSIPADQRETILARIYQEHDLLDKYGVVEFCADKFNSSKAAEVNQIQAAHDDFHKMLLELGDPDAIAYEAECTKKKAEPKDFKES